MSGEYPVSSVEVWNASFDWDGNGIGQVSQIHIRLNGAYFAGSSSSYVTGYGEPNTLLSPPIKAYIDGRLVTPLAAQWGPVSLPNDGIRLVFSEADRPNPSSHVAIEVSDGFFYKNDGTSMSGGHTANFAVSDWAALFTPPRVKVDSLVTATLPSDTDDLNLLGSTPIDGTGNDRDNKIEGNGGANRLDGKGGADSLNGGDGADTLAGGTGDDHLTGGASTDQFLANAGTDLITDLGFGGNDTLTVSAGATAVVHLAAIWSARFSNNAGIVNLTAHGFNVALNGALGANGWTVTNAGNGTAISIIGSVNNDTLSGGLGNDTLIGGRGVDYFSVEAGIDSVRDLGVGGADIIVVSAGAEAKAVLGTSWQASSETSNDGTAAVATNGFNANLNAATGPSGWSISNSGNGSAVSLTGSSNDDAITGGTASDTLTGGNGEDTLTGGLGTDRFMVDAGSDNIKDLGFGGGDALIVAAGATANATLAAKWVATTSTMNDGTGNIFANGFGVDLTAATGTHGWAVTNPTKAFAVTLTGSAQDDALTGGNGKDSLVGGAGADTLAGGGSQDRLTGGVGADVFRYTVLSDSSPLLGKFDQITDFSQGEGDRIDLSALDAVAGGVTNEAFTFIGTAELSMTNARGQLSYEYDSLLNVTLRA